MRSILVITFLTFSISALSETVERTLNEGQLILQDIPEIPSSIADELKSYQNIRSASFRGFDKAGDSIFISTRFANVSQLHQVHEAGGARNQVTFFDEPMGSISRQPGDNMIAFMMDSGGSENAQIFLLDPTTNKHRLVSDGKSRNGAMSWNRSGDKIAFLSTRRNGASNDVWIVDPNNPSSAEMVLASPDGYWWGPVDWDNGQNILIQNYLSIAKSNIYILDIKSKEKTLVAGSLNNHSVNIAQAFNHDDSGIFFITNQFSEFNQLAYKDLNSDQTKIITQDIPWDIDEFTISKDRTRAAFTVNENGISVVYLLDPKRMTYKKIKGLPIGLIGGMGFSENGKKLGLTINSSQTPSDTYVIHLSSYNLSYGDIERWTFSEVGGLNTEVFASPELFTYPTFDNKQIPAFIYRPDTDKPAPVIISIHGGPEGQYRPRFSASYQLWVKELGAAVIAPNVRGSDGYGKTYLSLDNGFNREDSVKDIGALIDWVATQPDLDASRIAVIGGSYGGYMVLASATHYSDKLKAAVDIVGISNFVSFLENTEDYRRDLRRQEYGDERIPEMREFLEAISPNNNVDKIDIPLFVVQGENDPRVPVTESEQIVKALRDADKAVWYMNALNEGHGYRKKENRDIYQQAVVLFFKEHL